MPIVKPIHARENEVVDIYWHTATDIFVERRAIPPKPTREARKLAGEDGPGMAIEAPSDAVVKETERQS